MAAHSGGGQANWGRRGPVCSGQAYFVTDGEPCNPQNFWDGILDGLGEWRTAAPSRPPEKAVDYLGKSIHPWSVRDLQMAEEHNIFIRGIVVGYT